VWLRWNDILKLVGECRRIYDILLHGCVPSGPEPPLVLLHPLNETVWKRLEVKDLIAGFFFLSLSFLIEQIRQDALQLQLRIKIFMVCKTKLSKVINHGTWYLLLLLFA
jgi:hypothetical protein